MRFRLFSRRKPEVKPNPDFTKAQLDYAIVGLKAVQKALTDFLERGEREIHKDMKQVSPGIWIHKDYRNLDEALDFLRSLLPSRPPSLQTVSDRPDASKLHEGATILSTKQKTG